MVLLRCTRCNVFCLLQEIFVFQCSSNLLAETGRQMKQSKQLIRETASEHFESFLMSQRMDLPI